MRAEPGCRQHRGHGVARRHHALHHEAVDQRPARIGAGKLDAVVGGNGGENFVARGRAQPSGQPVPGGVIAAVAPGIEPLRKGRKGSRVPGPRIDPCRVDHAVRVGRGVVPVREMRAQVLPLHQRVGRARRKERPRVLDALGVGEGARLVGSLVHRAAADLGEPDRLHPRHPGRRRNAAHASRAVVVETVPPAREILEPPDPVLAMSAVPDRRAHLLGPVGVRAIIPVVTLAAGDAVAQVADVVAAVPILGIEMRVAIAPVRQRHVIVDGHGIDIVRGPQRIEMEVFGAAAGLVTCRFRPVCRIGQFRARSHQRPRVRREIGQRLDKGKAVASAPDRRQPAHFRTDQQRVDAARFLAERRIVQHHVAIARQESGHLRARGSCPVG